MSATPAKHGLTLWKGATFSKQLSINQPNSTLPEDLTGYTASLVIRDRPGGAPLLSLTTGNGGITLGGPAGTINLFISDEDTATITWLSGAYALSLTDPGGDTDILLHGSFRALVP